MNSQYGTLYVVATPIGNLEDISGRAIQTLKSVGRVLAEDTRRTQQLFSHFGIRNQLVSLHDHNERQRVENIEQWLSDGEDLALVSDAGTPLISDPGYHVVSTLREKGFNIVPIPGASALIAALSVAGLPTDRFCFEGFLPAKPSGRRKKIASLKSEARTWVFYESSHRIQQCIDDLVSELGDERKVVIARELTKRFETVISGPLVEIVSILANDSNQLRGEFVVMVEGRAQEESTQQVSGEQLLSLLVPHLPTKLAAQITSEVTGENKKALYQQALEMKR
ncbi:16S rRNA (cytidine(1402)-2'-O)-methyltransferase [Pleionea litopenaei]|uniref:Ribosomal RNA small subunit methyltransferase I n=1 Tax=Pleionea litopenaei TaxID=3070815 RepID=A0AA51RWA7_9GAMM|nr:16S rRNA (cytidine(1402)-2'-O)-methyltransferase [Pleionea sp. HL-JVS1]WMS88684.1 16S rRNA (cytidine(1402)-2'-O)-methyltransferase [Pleionea sp. HL-JVS1]